MAGKKIEPLSMAPNTCVELDCYYVKKLFLKLKDKGILSESRKILIYDSQVDDDLLKSNNLMDKIHYYRKQKRISKRTMAINAGIDPQTYADLENKRNVVSNPYYIESFIQTLNIQDILELPNEYKFIKKFPAKKIIEHIEENFNDIHQFSKLTNINIETIRSWFALQDTLHIKLSSYKKLIEYWKKYCNYKED